MDPSDDSSQDSEEARSKRWSVSGDSGYGASGITRGDSNSGSDKGVNEAKLLSENDYRPPIQETGEAGEVAKRKKIPRTKPIFDSNFYFALYSVDEGGSIEECLKYRSTGTFLVSEGLDCKYILYVKAENSVRNWKIHEKVEFACSRDDVPVYVEGCFTQDAGRLYPNLDLLLEAFHHEPIPGCGTLTLKREYRK